MSRWSLKVSPALEIIHCINIFDKQTAIEFIFNLKNISPIFLRKSDFAEIYIPFTYIGIFSYVYRIFNYIKETYFCMWYSGNLGSAILMSQPLYPIPRLSLINHDYFCITFQPTNYPNYSSSKPASSYSYSSLYIRIYKETSFLRVTKELVRK